MNESGLTEKGLAKIVNTPEPGSSITTRIQRERDIAVTRTRSMPNIVILGIKERAALEKETRPHLTHYRTREEIMIDHHSYVLGLRIVKSMEPTQLEVGLI